MAIAVLEPYRRYGVASKLIQEIITLAKNISSSSSSSQLSDTMSTSGSQTTTPTTPTPITTTTNTSTLGSNSSSMKKKINKIELHVPVDNSIGIQFYEKFGFVKIEKIIGYYDPLESTPSTSTTSGTTIGTGHDNGKGKRRDAYLYRKTLE